MDELDEDKKCKCGCGIDLEEDCICETDCHCGENDHECHCSGDCDCGDDCKCTKDDKCNPNCTCGEECHCSDGCECGDNCSCGDDCKCEEKQDYLKDLLRVQAEFDNYRKRTVSARAEAIVDGKLEAIKAFLPVIDNIDRALLHAKDGDAVADGLKLIRKQVEKTLEDLNVELIGAVGDKFDPNLHEAVLQEPASEGMESGVISEVFQKGYKLGDKVIRYTMVKVTE